MTRTSPALPEADPGTWIRPGDTVRFHHRSDTGTVVALHCDLANGQPGVLWSSSDPGTEHGQHWSYLFNVAAVNGADVDYADRYAPAGSGQPDLADDLLEELPLLTAAREHLRALYGLGKVRITPAPVPDAFGCPPDAAAADADTPLDVELTFRTYVPGSVDHYTDVTGHITEQLQETGMLGTILGTRETRLTPA